MRILLLTAETECHKCREAKGIIRRVTERYPAVEALTLRYDDPEAERFGIVMSPTVVVEDTIIASGRAPNERKLMAYVEAALGEGGAG